MKSTRISSDTTNDYARLYVLTLRILGLADAKREELERIADELEAQWPAA